jgi:hypothetical protein
MRILILILVLAGCTKEQPPTVKKSPPVDLVAVVAEAVKDKPFIPVPTETQPKFNLDDLEITLCSKETIQPYAGKSAIEEAVRVINVQNKTIEDCANGQLRKIAEKLNLPIK